MPLIGEAHSVALLNLSLSVEDHAREEAAGMNYQFLYCSLDRKVAGVRTYNTYCGETFPLSLAAIDKRLLHTRC